LDDLILYFFGKKKYRVKYDDIYEKWTEYFSIKQRILLYPLSFILLVRLLVVAKWYYMMIIFVVCCRRCRLFLLQEADEIIKKLSSTELLNYENIVLNGWLESLSPEEREIFDIQYSNFNYIQRHFNGLILYFSYAENCNCPVFKGCYNEWREINVATVWLKDDKSEKEKLMKAKIIMVGGKFSGIKFPKRPRRYAKLHKLDLNNLKVAYIEKHVSLLT